MQARSNDVPAKEISQDAHNEVGQEQSSPVVPGKVQAMLGENRFHSVQRRGLFQQLGHNLGNRGVQLLVESLKTEDKPIRKPEPPRIHFEFSPVSMPTVKSAARADKTLPGEDEQESDKLKLRATDKTLPGEDEQESDKYTSQKQFDPAKVGDKQGVTIQISYSGGESLPDYPDGFRWSQTIETNVPLGGSSSPYVDPRPNDDDKPFYYTDAEEKSMAPIFYDQPKRATPATDNTYWQAILGLNYVDNAKKKVKGVEFLTYGFKLDTAGKLTPVAPASGNQANHQSVLKSEFGDWTWE